ncbi:MAG: DNA-binding domain-containing protein [Spirochaetota bacterium]
MALKYELLKNHLGAKPTGFHAVVVDHNIKSRAEFIDMMVKYSSSHNRGDMEAMMYCFDEAIKEALREGEGVNIGPISARLDIKGPFPHAESHYDPAVNSIAINLNATKELKAVIPDISVEKVYSSGNESKIVHVEDTLSGASDSKLTPSGPVKVTGYHIKIQAAATPDNKEGLYAIALSDGSEYKFTNQITNVPSELVYLAPALTAGDYRLEVRSYGPGSTVSKTLKTIYYDKTFRVD